MAGAVRREPGLDLYDNHLCKFSPYLISANPKRPTATTTPTQGRMGNGFQAGSSSERLRPHSLSPPQLHRNPLTLNTPHNYTKKGEGGIEKESPFSERRRGAADKKGGGSADPDIN